MKGKPTYECKECGYVARVSSETELEDEKKKHSLICNKELKMVSEVEGDCIKIAIVNCRQNPGWVFCYANLPGRIEGQTLLHSWNEFEGIVIDQSNNKNIIVAKEIYYKAKRITEDNVKKMNLHDVEKRMNRAEKKMRDAYSWIK